MVIGRARQEIINCQIKKFGALQGIWRHGSDKHGLVCRDAITIVQLIIEKRRLLFQFEGYEDRVLV